MKKLAALITGIIISGTLLAQIPNNGFETWTTVGGYSIPDGWDNLNYLTHASTVYTCEKGTPGDPGSFYLELTTKTVPGRGIIPGISVAGILDTATLKPKSGFAFAARPASFTGNWQFMGFGTDRGHIDILLSVWNAISSKRDTVSYTSYTLSSMIMSWNSFTIPLTYYTSAVPDSAIIFLSASGASPVVNSYLYVDNVAFSGNVSDGIITEAKTTNFSLNPNPAVKSLAIDYNCNTASRIRINIDDMNGRNWLSAYYIADAGKNYYQISLSDYPKGIYFIQIIDGQNSEIKKLIVE